MDSRTEFNNKYTELFGEKDTLYTKEDRLNEYLNGYTPENRFRFMELCLKKHYSQNYSMKNDQTVLEEDYVVTDQNLRNNIQEVINKNECSVNDFTDIFNQLDVDQIDYIGY